MRAGLKKVVKTVKGKKKSVRRTYWVKAAPPPTPKKSFARRALIIGGSLAALGALTYAQSRIDGAHRRHINSLPSTGTRMGDIWREHVLNHHSYG